MSIGPSTFGMVSFMSISMFVHLGCFQAEVGPRIRLPPYPLCFVEEDPNNNIGERIGHNITPEPIKHALLIPYFMAPSRQRFIACPFVYKHGDAVRLPQERMPYQAQYEGTIVLCSGYLPTNINDIFPYIDTINGKKCQLIELSKACDNDEALRVLDDWAGVLRSRSFSVTGTLDLRKETKPVPLRYATCEEVFNRDEPKYATELGIDSPTTFGIWPYEIGTIVTVELTPKDVAIVEDFMAGEKKMLSAGKQGNSEVEKGESRERE